MTTGRRGLYGRVDAVAHVLHRCHLIPARWLAAVCDRYELWLGVTLDELYRAKGRTHGTA